MRRSPWPRSLLTRYDDRDRIFLLSHRCIPVASAAVATAAVDFGHPGASLLRQEGNAR